MRINSCWQFMGSDRAREWTGSCLGGVRVRGSKKFSWLVHHHGLASHSYLICQTVYMGSGLPTRKSVLNHSMTSNFCLLYKHKLKHKRAFCRRLRWRGGTELRGNFVLTQFRGGAYYHQQSVSDLQLIGSGFLVWPASHVHSLRINTFTCESPASHLRRTSPCISWSIWVYWTLVFLHRSLEPGGSGWEATFLVGKPSLSALTFGTCWPLNIKYLTVNKSAVFRILGILLIQ